jgi:Mor family transcriptional regulator
MSTESVDLLELLHPEHLSGEQRKLAETIGIEAYRKLVRLYAGTGAMYIPTVDQLTRNVRDSLIRDEYTGYNQRELALKYGISEQWVRSIVGPVKPPLEGQISLFDEAAANTG